MNGDVFAQEKDDQQPHFGGGSLLRDLERPNWLPPASPELVDDNVGIPADAYHVMTMVGSDANPALLLDARFIAQYETESIPEVVELLPNEERIPYPNDPRFPY